MHTAVEVLKIIQHSTANSINRISTESNGGAAITEQTTLGELLSILGVVERAAKTPTVKKLREGAGEPIAEEERCKAYANGYAVYENETGRTVVWVPGCTSFTHRFDPMKESEKGGEIKETITLPDGLLESQPWPITVTLIGDHRMEINSMNRSGGRTGTKDYDSADKQQLISLTEFEKRMGKKHFAEILGKFVMKPPGKLALVPESDPRPPVDLTSTCDQEFLHLFSRALFLWR